MMVISRNSVLACNPNGEAFGAFRVAGVRGQMVENREKSWGGWLNG